VSPCAHHHPIDELAAFAVGAIDDPAERRAIEGHLAHCSACWAQLRVHEEVLSSLIEDEAPPPSLWAEIAERVGGPTPAVIVGAQFGAVAPARPGDAPASAGPGDEVPVPPALRAAPPAAPAPAADPVVVPYVPRHKRDRRHTRRTRRLGMVAAAAAMVAAVVAAPLAWASLTRSGGGSGEPEVAAVLTAADGGEVARVVEGDDGAMVIELDHVAALPEGRTYQLWSLGPEGTAPTSLGLLGDGHDTSVPVDVPAGTTRVAISDEPAGGSPAPTGLIAGAGTVA